MVEVCIASVVFACVVSTLTSDTVPSWTSSKAVGAVFVIFSVEVPSCPTVGDSIVVVVDATTVVAGVLLVSTLSVVVVSVDMKAVCMLPGLTLNRLAAACRAAKSAGVTKGLMKVLELQQKADDSNVPPDILAQSMPKIRTLGI